MTHNGPNSRPGETDPYVIYVTKHRLSRQGGDLVLKVHVDEEAGTVPPPVAAHQAHNVDVPPGEGDEQAA